MTLPNPNQHTTTHNHTPKTPTTTTTKTRQPQPKTKQKTTTLDMTKPNATNGYDKPPKCGAKTRSRKGTCELGAGWGTDHPGVGRCCKHGGNTPTHVKGAQRLIAARTVAEFGGRLDISPAESLLELVQTKAAEVAFWRHQLMQIDGGGIPLFGVTKKEAGIDKGETTNITTAEAKPPVEYELLRQAERDLATYSAAALKAGVDEALVKIAAVQASTILDVITRLMDRLQIPDAQRPDLITAALEPKEKE